MGKVPGVAAGYAVGPERGGQRTSTVNPTRKHSNHAFYGPGYPIAHPGIFPHNPKASAGRSSSGCKFDWRAGWGHEGVRRRGRGRRTRSAGSRSVGRADDRVEAREIIDENLQKLEQKRDLRRQVMENGSHIDGPFFDSPPTSARRCASTTAIHNTNPGHNLPSGSLGAQPRDVGQRRADRSERQARLGVGLRRQPRRHGGHPLARRAAGKSPVRRQFFNLQTKFLTTNVKGTDREMYLPVNFDIDRCRSSGRRACRRRCSIIRRSSAWRSAVDPAARRPRSPKLHGAGRADDPAGHVQARVPHAQPRGADLLHEVRQGDGRDGAEQ